MRAAWLFAPLLLLAACSTFRAQDPSMDGWPLGSPTNCKPIGIDASADDVIGIARDHLGLPHAAIIDATCYREGGYLDNGQPYVAERSMDVVIVVFTFEDQSRRARGVVCGVGGCGFAGQPQRGP